MGSLFSEPRNPLIIHAGIPEPRPSNQIKTTSYNVFTFLPLATLVQFKRLANVYFLVTAVLQFIPIISPLSPGAAIAPLIFVLVVSLIRSAVEEIGKYRYDMEANSNMFEVYVENQIQGDDSVTSNKQSAPSASWQLKRSDQLQVGNLIRVNQDQRFPADIILLSSSNQDGKAYIQTSSLDGEKNLKQRSSVPVLQPHYLSLESIQSVSHNKPLLTLQEPNEQLYSFNGKIEYTKIYDKPIYGRGGRRDERCSEFLKISQLLYRQSVLRNTKHVVGVIAYVGRFTKSMMNSSLGSLKMSKLERKVNFYMIFIFVFQLLLILVCGLLNIYLFYSTSNSQAFFSKVLNQTPRDYALEAALTSCSYFVLLNTMIPISLLVSIEIVKFGQAWFIDSDQLISRREKDGSLTYSRVFRSSINEELGMVQHIFTDKTGTITKNEMQLQKLLIGNQIYQNEPRINEKAHRQFYFNKKLGKFGGSIKIQKLRQCLSTLVSEQESTDFEMAIQETMNTIFLLVMAVCHECLYVPAGSQGNEEDEYQGSSPDEITLVDSAARLGLKFMGMNNGKVLLKTPASQKPFEVQICDVFEFDSDRKRMSVIVDIEGLHGYKLLLTKGADSSIDRLLLSRYKQVDGNPRIFYDRIKQQISDFSKDGLRTLLVGYKLLPNQEYLPFKKILIKKSDYPVEMQQCVVKLEEGVHLCGATVVEDKLQDNVESTIEDIIQANIKICMLTGDKMETAESIAKSCRLFHDSWTVVRIGENSGDMDIFRGYCEVKGKIELGEKFGIVIQGAAIARALASVYFQDMFQHCSACVCCRITPKNKAEVVMYAKNKLNKLVLSIGDGANDVPMIQAANIGIGIYGNEGMNAVQASDFAIPEFQGLWRMLFVHGRWNYIRIAELIKYFFYKNMVFTMGQFWYSYVCGFSAQSIYNGTYLVLFNTIFTGGPVIVRALLEQDLNYVKVVQELRIKEETYIKNNMKKDQLQSPSVSKRRKGSQGEESKGKVVTKFQIDGTLKKLYPMLYEHSQGELSLTPCVFAFLVIEAILESLSVFLTIYFGIEVPELSIFSICLYSVILALVSIRICYDISYWTWLMVCSILFTSVLPYILFIFVMSIFEFGLTGTFTEIFQLTDFYLCLILALGFGAFLQSTFNVIRKYYFPTAMERVQMEWRNLKSREMQNMQNQKQVKKQLRRDSIKEEYFKIFKKTKSIDKRNEHNQETEMKEIRQLQAKNVPQ